MLKLKQIKKLVWVLGCVGLGILSPSPSEAGVLGVSPEVLFARLWMKAFKYSAPTVAFLKSNNLMSREEGTILRGLSGKRRQNESFFLSTQTDSSGKALEGAALRDAESEIFALLARLPQSERAPMATRLRNALTRSQPEKYKIAVSEMEARVKKVEAAQVEHPAYQQILSESARKPARRLSDREVSELFIHTPYPDSKAGPLWVVKYMDPSMPERITAVLNSLPEELRPTVIEKLSNLYASAIGSAHVGDYSSQPIHFGNAKAYLARLEVLAEKLSVLRQTKLTETAAIDSVVVSKELAKDLAPASTGSILGALSEAGTRATSAQ